MHEGSGARARNAKSAANDMSEWKCEEREREPANGQYSKFDITIGIGWPWTEDFAGHSHDSHNVKLFSHKYLSFSIFLLCIFRLNFNAIWLRTAMVRCLHMMISAHTTMNYERISLSPVSFRHCGTLLPAKASKVQLCIQRMINPYWLPWFRANCFDYIQ